MHTYMHVGQIIGNLAVGGEFSQESIWEVKAGSGTKHHQQSGLNSRSLLSYGLGGWKSAITASAVGRGVVSSEAGQEHLLQVSPCLEEGHLLPTFPHISFSL